MLHALRHYVPHPSGIAAHSRGSALAHNPAHTLERAVCAGQASAGGLWAEQLDGSSATARRVTVSGVE